MSDRELDVLSAALRRAARSDDARPLPDARAREMVMRALAAAREDEDRGTEQLPLEAPISRWGMAGAGLALAAAAASLLAWAPPVVDAPLQPPSAMLEPTRSILPTGDELIASPGAEYTVESVRPQRRVRVGRGSVLCDVRSLGEGTSFALATPHLEVEVLGTVFSVRVLGERSDVWVYEGRVRVVIDGEERVLGAGESTSASEIDPLAERGRAGALRRGDHAADAVLQGDAVRGRPRRAAPVESRDDDTPSARDERSDALRASLDEVRALLARDRAEEALHRADAELELLRASRSGSPRSSASARPGDEADWLVLRADALRALGRAAEAVLTLERALALAPDRRRTIGYRIASARWRSLGDPEGALDALELHGVTEPGSPLAERGLALEIDISGELGRTAERRRAVDTYLERFPSTSRARELRDRP
jgi:hypothetical protein